ncbi:MAG: molybdopterin-dependent oxidoreductase [Actinobacteria bacterium]|nr:molybdopterin-dependent oxidoreductase [Actinomycetota bacterium]
MAARARFVDGQLEIEGVVAKGGLDAFRSGLASEPLGLGSRVSWTEAPVAGPPVSTELRAVGLAEHAVLVAGALAHAGVHPSSLVDGDRAAAVLLDTLVASTDGALAGARIDIDPDTAQIRRVAVSVAAGDVLDWATLRSYAIGAAHMAIGWVLSESIAVDPTGGVHDLTIRSFGILRARDMPRVEVRAVDDSGPPIAVSDAVFAAVAAATWNAVTVVEGTRPEVFPARGTRVARQLRR